MKALWATYSAKIDALTLRERVFVFAAIAAVIVLIANTFLLGPLFDRRARLNEQINQQNNNLIGLNSEITARIDAYNVDPDISVRKHLADVKGEIASINAGLRSMQQGLVAPDRIVPLLDGLLKSNGRLHVMSLKTLPVSGIGDPLPGDPKVEAPAPATPPNGQALLAATVPVGGKPADAAKDVPVAPVVTPSQLLYRHGVEITVEGGYLDMVNYMSALEAMPTQLFWGKAALDVQQYPRTRLTLTLYTLSLDQKWMKL